MCFKAFLVVVFFRGFVLVSIFSFIGFFFFFRGLELALVCFVFRVLAHALHAHGRMENIDILRHSCRVCAELV